MSLQDLFAALGGGFSGFGDWKQRDDAKKLEQQKMAAAEKARLDDVQFRNTQAAKSDWRANVDQDFREKQLAGQQANQEREFDLKLFGETAPNTELTGRVANFAKSAGLGKHQQFLPGADAPKTTGIFDMLAGGGKTDTEAFTPIAEKFVRPENVQERSARVATDANQTRIDQAVRESKLWQDYAALTPEQRNSDAGDAILMQVVGKQPYREFKNEQTLNAQDNAAAMARTVATQQSKPTRNALSQQANQTAQNFDNEPEVKMYQTVASGLKTFETLGSDPTDDIARIYTFAKIMDPGSTVREGEYKTIQDYAQALLTKIGIRLERVVDNRGFLTPEARQMMQNTLGQKLKTHQAIYDNVYNEYGRRIEQADRLAPGTGTLFLTDYGAAFRKPKGNEPPPGNGSFNPNKPVTRQPGRFGGPGGQ